MDGRRTWSDGAGIPDDWCRLRLCADGGLRKDGSAALGFAVLEAIPGESGYVQKVVFRAGHLVERVQSAFEAEALALEAGVDW